MHLTVPKCQLFLPLLYNLSLYPCNWLNHFIFRMKYGINIHYGYKYLESFLHEFYWFTICWLFALYEYSFDSFCCLKVAGNIIGLDN